MEHSLGNLKTEQELRINLEKFKQTSLFKPSLDEDVEDVKAFKKLLLNSPIVIFTQNKNLIYTWAYTPVNGFDLKNITGKTDEDLLPENEAKTLTSLKLEVLTKGNKIKKEIKIKYQQKDYFFDIAIEPILRGGLVNGVTSVFVDITERKQVEERTINYLKDLTFLSESAMMFVESERLKDFFTFVAKQIYSVERNCIVVLNEYNPKSNKNTIMAIEASKKDKNIISKTMGNVPLGISFPSTKSVMKYMRKGELIKVPDNFNFSSLKQISLNKNVALKKNLKLKDIYFMPFIWDGDIMGTVVLMTKTGKPKIKNRFLIETFINQASIALKRKKAEEKNQIQANILDQVSDAVVVFDKDQKIKYLNKAAERLYGVSGNKAIGKKAGVLPYKWITKEDGEDMGELFLKRQWKGESIITKRKGGEVYVESSLTTLKDNNGQPTKTIMVTRDISDRKELENRKDEFISLASHELKTPITSIKAYTQILQKKIKNKKTNHIISNMIEQLDEITTMVGDFLDISRIKTGKIEYKDEAFDLNKTIKDVVEYIRQTTNHKIIIKGKIKTKIQADKQRIEQVITNLLTNAIKFSPDSDKIILTKKESKKQTTVSIKDFGIGISREKQRRIFERFYQADTYKHGKEGGLGLGLYISSQIIKHYRGKIWVESKLGKGSIFHFSIPL